MKPFLLSALAFLALTLFSAMAQETHVVAYPTIEEPSFLIEVPETWELTPAENDGEFFHLDGPTGALFSFRTIPGDEETLKAAIDDTLSHIRKLFTQVELSEAKDWTPGGLSGFYATGSGKSDQGEDVSIGVAWCELNDGKLAQMWFVTAADDAKGMREAENIANSLQSPTE